MEDTGVETFLVEIILNGTTESYEFPISLEITNGFVESKMRSTYSVTGGTVSLRNDRPSSVKRFAVGEKYYFIEFTPPPQTVATAGVGSTVLPKKVDCKQKLIKRGPCADIDEALQDDLGFRIPTINLADVADYPDIFEYGDWAFKGSVMGWLEHNMVGSSEHAVISLDYAWVGILQGFLPGLILYRDQYDPSSLPNLRPDLTMVYNHCVVLKAAATATEFGMNEAELSLTSKFEGNAYEMFPVSSTMVGVCSSATLVKIFKVSYNHQLQKYETTLFPQGDYRVGELSERIRFLVDILKFLRWISSVN